MARTNAQRKVTRKDKITEDSKPAIKQKFYEERTSKIVEIQQIGRASCRERV